MRETPQQIPEKINKVPFNNGNPVPKGINAEDFYAAASIVAREETKIKPKGPADKGPTYLEKIYKKTIQKLPELLKKIEDHKAGHITTKEDLMAYIKGTHIEETEEEILGFIKKDILDKSHPGKNIN